MMHTAEQAKTAFFRNPHDFVPASGMENRGLLLPDEEVQRFGDLVSYAKTAVAPIPMLHLRTFAGPQSGREHERD